MNQSLVTSHSSLSLTTALLPKAARRDFDFWRKHLEPLLDDASPARTGVCVALARIAQQTGVPVKTVMRKYYAAKKHGLVGLVDRRLAGPKWWRLRNGQSCVGLSEEDQELVKLYCENNQRSSRSAIKALIRDWKFGRVKTASPLDPRTGRPRGWSTNNLERYTPTEFERKATRIGRTAAKAHRPLVYTTRKDLWVGSHYMFDDMWHNFEVNSFIERQAGRPLELFSHDLFSARKLRWGIRVRTRKEDDSGFHGLAERMTRMILAATLYLDGYSPRGTVCIEELGTARLSRANIERDLYEISDGKITIADGGMQGAVSHAGQYPGVSRGNPNFKASLESSNNLTQNVFAALPGQTGKDRNHQPEEHAALMKHNENLLAVRNYLSPERAALLEFPILELQQFMLVAHDLYRAIEDDTEHDLEGWDLNTVVELQLGGQWIDQRLLDRPQAELALALVQGGKLSTRPRKMSRREIWSAGAASLIRIPGHGVCAILGDDLARERKVRSNMFEFDDREVGPGTHRYYATAKTPHGEELRLRDGEDYETFVNPFAPETLFVRRANGGYIGECRRITKPCRADVEAVQRLCGAAAKEESALLAPIRIRHLKDARDKTARHQRNSAVVSGKPLSAIERIRAAQDRTHNADLGRMTADVAELAEIPTQDSFDAESETENGQLSGDDLSAEGLL